MKYLKKEGIIELNKIVCKDVINIILDYHKEIHEVYLDILNDRKAKSFNEQQIKYFKKMIIIRNRRLNQLQIKRPEFF